MLGFWVLGSGFWVLGSWVLGSWFDSRCRTPNQNPEPRTKNQEPFSVSYPGPIVQFPIEIEVGQLPSVLLEVIALGRKQIGLNHTDNSQLQRSASGQVHRLVFIGVDERFF